MTATESREVERTELVTLTIDGVETSVPKGTLVIRAAERIGVQIPRFCDHPLLAPVGACRQCLVEVALPDRDGNLKTMMGPPGRVKPHCRFFYWGYWSGVRPSSTRSRMWLLNPG